MSTPPDAYRTLFNEERFWDGVREGQSRSRTLNNLIDFEERLLEFNTKILKHHVGEVEQQCETKLGNTGSDS